jgi:hypothetical protein
MARLPISGSTVATPHLDQADLRNVLVELCPEGDFNESDSKEFYRRLARIIGHWSAEHDRPDIAPIVKQLMQTSKDLDAVCKLLHGHETGIREDTEIQFMSQLKIALELDATVGSMQQAEALIASLRRDAAAVSDACRSAASELKTRVGKDGRPRLEWNDYFTALLLDIAETAGVEPRLSKDRISGAWVGWLLDAAQALEAFLDPQMRSPTAEACGKRLERSKTRLKQKYRQNPSSA